jgi:hypothetical protein
MFQDDTHVLAVAFEKEIHSSLAAHAMDSFVRCIYMVSQLLCRTLVQLAISICASMYTPAQVTANMITVPLVLMILIQGPKCGVSCA